jgi:hypothetical protein
LLTLLHRNDGILVSFATSLGPEDAFVGESAVLSVPDHTHRVIDHRTHLRTIGAGVGAGLIILLRLLCWEGQRQREGEDCCDGEDVHSGEDLRMDGLGFGSDDEI